MIFLKKIISILLISSLIYSVCLPHVFAKQQEVKEDCAQKIGLEKEKFEQKVMDDVLETYNIDLSQEKQVISYDINDLRKISLLTGKSETSLEGIYQQFESISLGQKQLLFLNGNTDMAYILYKDPQYKNIMITLTRGEGKWNVNETQVKEGEKIDFTKENCKDEHIINKGFNGIFRGLN